MEALGIEIKFDNPFADRERYVYTIVEPGGSDKVLNNSSLRANGLAFNDMKFARQVALHQLLYRLLLKYAYDANTIDCSKWNADNEHFAITKNDSGFYDVRVWRLEKSMNTVYFCSKEAVLLAINKVIKPFEKEYSEFMW